MTLLGCYLALIFLCGLVSRWLERTMVTGPILFTLAGILALPLLPELREHGVGQEAFLRMAELGLVLLLFTDASRTNLRQTRDRRSLSGRLLSTGMLLTLLLGAVGAKAVFPSLTLAEAGILAAILAPTDAGLGQVIVNSERVPLRIRQALNVEAGLNDGLSVPFLLFFMALAAGESGEPASLTRLIGEQLGLGVAIGAGIGLLGGLLLGLAARRQWIAASWRPLAVVALPLLCLVAPGSPSRSGSGRPASTTSSSPRDGASSSTWPSSSCSACSRHATGSSSASATRSTPRSASRSCAWGLWPSRSPGRGSAGRPCCSWAGSARAGWRPSCSASCISKSSRTPQPWRRSGRR
jgi:hypothetical protein